MESATKIKALAWAFNISINCWKVIIIHSHFYALWRGLIKILQFFSKLFYHIWRKIFICSLKPTKTHKVSGKADRQIVIDQSNKAFCCFIQWLPQALCFGVRGTTVKNKAVYLSLWCNCQIVEKYVGTDWRSKYPWNQYLLCSWSTSDLP